MEDKFVMTRYGLVKLDGEKFRLFDQEHYNKFVRKETRIRNQFDIPLPEDQNHWIHVYKLRLHDEFVEEKASKNI
jgi:hypothetical protein